eukprot:Gregarina_sp_Poly_1__11236@NODE_926_length_5683_cov_246_721510_g659_i0_p5_GENE_NODE_926_length_5683_cov_246_721510_g659_i0NODE_926_length_5683_cov_246_721510_g659_i0_p5_ORF_typecomplete_len143_score29_72_NODE_926_length_5683_cov_246_721510_g659_i069497
MIVDIQVDGIGSENIYSTSIPDDFLDCMAPWIGGDKVIGVKHSTTEHLICVRVSREILGFALIVASRRINDDRQAEMAITEAVVTDNGKIAADIIIEEAKMMARCANAQLVCAEDLLARCFPHSIQNSQQTVTLRTLLEATF